MIETKPQLKRVCRAIIQLVIGTYDEDGNLTEEELQQPHPIYYPFGLNTEEIVRKKNKNIEEK
jgi:hypothetical protein